MQVHFLALPVLVSALGAAVVLHVAGPARVVAGLVDPLHRVPEFGQNVFVGFVKDVGQHVEPAPVGHADQDVAGVVLRGLADHPVQDEDHGVQAFDGEPGLAGESPVQELLENLHLGETVEDGQCALVIFRGSEPPRFRGLLQPFPLSGHLDVHVVVTGGGGIDALEFLEGLGGVVALLAHRTADQGGGQLPHGHFGHALRLQFQLGQGVAQCGVVLGREDGIGKVPGIGQGVQVGAEMSILADVLGEIGDEDDLVDTGRTGAAVGAGGAGGA